MGDRARTKTELIAELVELRRKVAELEALESQRCRESEEQARAATHDTLTGLPNRTLFYDHLCQAIALAKRNQQLAAVMFFSIDRFKLINDTLGHDIGDLLLKELAVRLRASLRQSDVLARPGRDEFMILLLEIRKPADAMVIAERIFSSLSRPFLLQEYELVVTGSIGISLYPGDGTNAEHLIRNAYTAMSRAREEGRNTYRLFTPQLISKAFDSLMLENSIRLALQRNEFRLHYQPQVDLVSGRIVGVEALLRWEHPTLGGISPARFIPLAEQIGLIGPLSEWVIHMACAQNKALQNGGFMPMRVAVNLSPRQLHQKSLLHTIAGALEASGLEPGFLEVEITEGALITNVTSTTATLNSLDSMGVHVVVDDFGTGYSSLSYLSHFKLDKLKIDKSFIGSIATDRNNAAISRAIIALAGSLGLRVIAEGVETVEQLDFLRTFGCHEVQGYLFSRPLDVTRLERLLSDTRHVNGSSPADRREKDGFWPHWGELASADVKRLSGEDEDNLLQ